MCDHYCHVVSTFTFGIFLARIVDERGNKNILAGYESFVKFSYAVTDLEKMLFIGTKK